MEAPILRGERITSCVSTAWLMDLNGEVDVELVMVE